MEILINENVVVYQGVTIRFDSEASAHRFMLRLLEHINKI